MRWHDGMRCYERRFTSRFAVSQIPPPRSASE